MISLVLSKFQVSITATVALYTYISGAQSQQASPPRCMLPRNQPVPGPPLGDNNPLYCRLVTPTANNLGRGCGRAWPGRCLGRPFLFSEIERCTHGKDEVRKLRPSAFLIYLAKVKAIFYLILPLAVK